MDINSLKLHFAQLIRAWEKSKHNQYSESSKTIYQDTIRVLIKLLSEESFDHLAAPDIEERKMIINFIFKSLGILDSSTTNQFPFEIIYCLRYSLYEWINNDTDNYVIVTALTNSYKDYYSFDGELATDEDIYKVIKKVYNIEFKNRLIQINLPKFLSRDYFNNPLAELSG